MDREGQKEADRLLAGLEHADEGVRLESLRGIAQNVGAPALRVLRKSAKGDASPAVRAEALRLLAEVADRLSGTDLSGQGASTRAELLVGDPDPGVRAQAVAALTMSFDARVPEILIAALDVEQDATVLETLIQAVASEGSSVAPRLIRFLAHDDPRVRAAAVEVLGDTKDDALLGHLVPLLEDRHERVRVAAVRALRSARQEAVLACVDEMLTRAPERDVRAALYVLRYFASAISVPRLAPRLGANAPAVSAMARASLSSLAKKGSRRARRALDKAGLNSSGVDLATISGLRKIVQDPKVLAAADQRLAAVLQVVKENQKDKLPGIRGKMDTEDDPRVLAAMVTAVGRMGKPGDVPLLATYLGHKRSRVRAAAVKAVNTLDPRAVSMLLPALRDRSSRVRAQAIVCMADAKGINVMGSLRQMATSRDPRVVLTAVWTAAKLRSDGAREVLESLSASADADVRAEALRALGRGALPAAAPRTTGKSAASVFNELVSAKTPAPDASADRGAEPANGSGSIVGPDFSGLLGEADENTTVLIEGVPPAESELYEPADGPPAPPPRERPLRLDTHRIPKHTTVRTPAALAAPNETYMGEPIGAEPAGDAVDAGASDRAKAALLAAALAAAQEAQVAQVAQDQAGVAGRRGESQRLPAGTPRASTRLRGDAPPQPRGNPMAIAGGALAACAAVLMFMLLPGTPGTIAPPPVVASAPPPPRPASAAPSAPPVVEEVRVTFGPMAAPPATLWNPPEQTIEEVEANIKAAHAARGITSRPIIHLMAMDFMQASYRASIARAREMAEAGKHDDALAELDATLEKLPADHLAGRVAVLRALVTIAREGEKFDRLKKYRATLLIDQGKLIEIATEAAKDGGLRDHELKNLLARIKEAEKQRAEATHSADWLSGDNMFSDQPEAGNEKGG